MRRIGSIYCRDLSKSKDKIIKNPHRHQEKTGKLKQQPKYVQRGYKMEYESDEDTVYRSTSEQGNAIRFETEGRQISFSDTKQTQSDKILEYSKTSEPHVIRKLTYLNSIIKQIGILKTCGLKAHQSQKICEIEDRLLGFQRKLLQNQKQNYI